MSGARNSGWRLGFSGGRIIVPGTARQLAAFGLFRPSPHQGQAPGGGQPRLADNHVAVRDAAVRDTAVRQTAARHAAVKHAEGGLLWISLQELLEQNMPAEELTGLAAEYGMWVVDADVPEIVSGSSRLAKRFVEVAGALEQCDVTVFLVSASPLNLDPANPLSTLALVESSEQLPVEGVHGS